MTAESTVPGCTVIPGTRSDADTRQAFEDVLTQVRDEIDDRDAAIRAARSPA